MKGLKEGGGWRCGKFVTLTHPTRHVHYRLDVTHILSQAIQKNFSCRELNQKLMEVESELDDMKNQKNAGEMEKDSELGKKYTDHL